MYRIYFYKDSKGRTPVYEYLLSLKESGSKDARIKANSISRCLYLLKQDGVSIGEPYVKHLDAEIWELRPIRDRILFAACLEKSFVLLHCFMKKTQKTPAGEIEKAKKELAYFVEEMKKNEQ